jgi:hypothetical protein
MYQFWILDFGFWILDFGFWILDLQFNPKSKTIISGKSGWGYCVISKSYQFWILDLQFNPKSIQNLKLSFPVSQDGVTAL